MWLRIANRSFRGIYFIWYLNSGFNLNCFHSNLVLQDLNNSVVGDRIAKLSHCGMRRAGIP